MSRLSERIQKLVRQYDLARHLPPTATYEGAEGTAWFAGDLSRAPSIAEYFCGDDVRPTTQNRTRRHRVPDHIEQVACAGGLPIVRLPNPDQGLSEILPRAVAVPSLVDIHTDLPGDADTLRDELKTSTTREDFRRIRKAGFTYRITTDPEAIREFHARHYTPLIETQFPEDGRIASVENMLSAPDRGGELLCADIDGEWVAGILNVADETSYSLGGLGIRDADNSVRQKRVVAALIIRSLERAVELGLTRATLGRSLPFLGKGPLWFKVKWGGVVTLRSGAKTLHMFMDLRNERVRQLLSTSPVIHTSQGDSLATSVWLEPGDENLQNTIRDSGRFPGVAIWHVLGEPETISAGMEQLSASELIVPIAVTPAGDRPVWLGDVLSNSSVSP